MMKRATAISAALACSALVLPLASCRPARSADAARDPGTVVLRLAESLNAEHPSAQAGDYFASLVHERSGGRIRIRSYYGGKLGTPEQVIAQVQFGGIAMARVNSLELAEAVPRMREILEAGIYSGGAAMMGRVEAFGEAIADACQRERLTPLVFYFPDIRCVYGDVAHFRSVADFEGVRIGAVQSGILKDALESLGSVPVNLVSADTYKSLRSGYIHARETTFSEFVLSDDYPFVANVSLSRYLASPDLIVMSPEVLNDLSDQDRRLIALCARDSYDYQKGLLEKFHLEWIPRLEADGKDVFWEDDEFKSEIRAAIE